MTAQDNIGLFTLTKPVVSAHPALLEAKAFTKNGKPAGEPKFGIRLLFDPDSDDLKALKAVAVAVARARWPGRDLKELHFPFENGDKLAEKRKAKSGKDDGAFQCDKVVVTARSKYQPKLGILEGARLVDLDSEALIGAHKSKFYFGVKVFAQLNLVAYEGGTGPDGVTAYLQSVLSTNKGDKIAGGGQSVSETFKAYVGSVTVEDPTGADLDDEIPY